MAIIVCPKCHTENRIDDTQLPKIDKIRCKFCRHVFRAPLSQRKDDVSEDDISPSKGNQGASKD